MLSRLVVSIVLGAAVTTACSSNAPQERPALQGGQVYALETSYMQHCLSEANTSSDKQAQQSFMRDHPVTPLHLNTEDVWLDYEVQYKNQFGIAVRYFAGPKGGHPCMFGLVSQAGRPEVEAAMIRYTTADGKPAHLYDYEACLSTAPPTFATGSDGVTVTTLRCDVIVGRL